MFFLSDSMACNNTIHEKEVTMLTDWAVMKKFHGRRVPKPSSRNNAYMTQPRSKLAWDDRSWVWISANMACFSTRGQSATPRLIWPIYITYKHTHTGGYVLKDANPILPASEKKKKKIDYLVMIQQEARPERMTFWPHPPRGQYSSYTLGL